MQKVPARSLHGNREFMLLWVGQALSDLGSAITILALPLVAVAVLQASALEAGVLIASGTVANVLVALPAGVLVDRLPKRVVMIWCDVVRFIALGSLPALSAWGELHIWHLYVAAFVSGVSMSVFGIAYQSYLPDLVDKDQLIDANAKLSTTLAITIVLGPALGGVLVGTIGGVGALALDAASFLVSGMLLAAIRAPDRSSGTTGGLSLRREVALGLAFVFRDRTISRITAAAASLAFFSQMLFALEMVFLIRDLNVSHTWVAVPFALAGLGGVAGGLVAKRLAQAVGPARIIWLSIVGVGWLTLLIPLAAPGVGLVLYAVGVSAYFVVSVIFNVTQNSYRQTVCPPDFLGRMNASFRWVVWSVMPVGGLLGGVLGDAIGVRGTIWLACAGIWASGLWVLFSPLRGLRGFDVAPDASAPEPTNHS